MAVAAGVSFWALGLYVTPLEQEFGWSRSALQIGFSISLAISGIASPLAGKLIDRRGARFTIVAGTVLTVASYLLLATTDTLWEWYLYQSINAFFRSFMFYIPFQVLISSWFNRKRGRAVGIMATGFSLGVILYVVMQQLIDGVGWRSSFIFAAVALAVIFLPVGMLVVRNRPSDMGLEVDGEPAPTRAGGGRQLVEVTGLTVKQALRTPNFWAIAFAFMCFFFGMFGWMVNGTPVYESYGIPRGTISVLMMAGGLGGVISRPVFGYLAERIPSVEAASVVLAAFLIGGFAALLLTDASWLGIGIFISCWFIGSAGGPVLEPLILPRVFGLAHFGAIMGTMFMVETIGQVVAPYIGGWIFDQTGGYDLLLQIFIGSLFASMGFFGLAHFLPNPRIPSARAALTGAINLVARRAVQHAVQHVTPRERGAREAVGD